MSGRTDSVGTKFIARLLFAWVVIAAALYGTDAANAQGWVYRGDITPNRQILDSRGVDIQFGEISVTTEPVSAGDLASAASWTGITDFSQLRASIVGAKTGVDRYVFIHGKTFKFTNVGGTYVPANGDGSTLVS